LAGALGLGSLAGLGGASAASGEPRVSSAEAIAAPPPERASIPQPERASIVEVRQRGFERGAVRPPRWAMLVPAGMLAVLLAWGISSLGRRHAPESGVTAPQATAPTLRAPEVPWGRGPTAVAGGVALPGGKTLDVAPGSAAAQMAQALGDASTPLPHAFAL